MDQKPEFILDVIRNQHFQNLKIVFIGSVSKHNFDLTGVHCQVEFIETLPHDKFQKYMQENVDIGMFLWPAIIMELAFPQSYTNIFPWVCQYLGFYLQVMHRKL